jgi:hypothetical protein
VTYDAIPNPSHHHGPLARRDFLRVAALGGAALVGGWPRSALAGRGGGAGGRILPFGTANGQPAYWGIKVSSAKVGPGPNLFSDATDDVWTDLDGRLHLTITKHGGRWWCTEVIGQSSFGYGTYCWTSASDVSGFDPSVVLGLFTWNDAPDYAHREIDIEFAKWSDLSTGKNAQYTVQPSDATHRSQFVEPATPVTNHEFTWHPGMVDFRSTDAAGAIIGRWQYQAADVPVPGGENPRMNLWLFRGKVPASGNRVHVILSNFVFTSA